MQFYDAAPRYLSEHSAIKHPAKPVCRENLRTAILSRHCLANVIVICLDIFFPKQEIKENCLCDTDLCDVYLIRLEPILISFVSILFKFYFIFIFISTKILDFFVL